MMLDLAKVFRSLADIPVARGFEYALVQPCSITAVEVEAARPPMRLQEHGYVQ